MADFYIPRTLIRDRGQDNEAVLTEADIPLIKAPIVILGDPGLGKTQLTKTLEVRYGFKRVSAGTFYRMQNYAALQTAPDGKLIIDGLDEITSSSGISAIDEVLRKLSELHSPNFILSCALQIGKDRQIVTKLAKTTVPSRSLFISSPLLLKTP
ncbi:hypothetical protein [Bradyrhizobium sp. 62]|uniref:hypothetical protein n=1 Tax=Bradyrhizobium sp. 62 TaxID=1043588 RepID=UPI001FF8AC8F|nr:hypothetical protein [Bradyrhizobium sp. 62]MCK1367056.1 hypothetical protein [Bradyrhizobium sp. 62]